MTTLRRPSNVSGRQQQQLMGAHDAVPDDGRVLEARRAKCDRDAANNVQLEAGWMSHDHTSPTQKQAGGMSGDHPLPTQKLVQQPHRDRQQQQQQQQQVSTVGGEHGTGVAWANLAKDDATDLQRLMQSGACNGSPRPLRWIYSVSAPGRQACQDRR